MHRRNSIAKLRLLTDDTRNAPETGTSSFFNRIKDLRSPAGPRAVRSRLSYRERCRWEA